MSRFRLSLEAQQDLRDIQTYMVEAGGTRLARYIRNEIIDAIRFLASNPGAGHSRSDLTPVPVKFWPVFSYLIVYDPIFKPLGVARIFHSARDLETVFEENPPKA